MEGTGRHRKEIAGQRFGRLVALDSESHRVGTRVYWWCRCDCGNVVAVARVDLFNGQTRSCGCLRRDMLRERNKQRRKAAEEVERKESGAEGIGK